MNLQQLRALCEVVRQGLHISGAAEALFRSQPGVSRQLQALENEIGTDLFVRKRNKIVGLTDAGRRITEMAHRALSEVDNMRAVGKEQESSDAGTLTVATSHTQARYTLPRVIKDFTKRRPKVHLSLRQGTAAQCYDYVKVGDADIAIATEVPGTPADLCVIPVYRLPRCIVTPARHPLLKEARPTLESVARYPIIYSDFGYGGTRIVAKAFAEHGLKPRVSVSATDSDVSKIYVELGLGIAILTNVSVDLRRDRALRAIDASHLFPPTTLTIVLRAHTYLRGYALDFITMFAPHLSHEDVNSRLAAAPKPSTNGGRNIPVLKMKDF